MKNYELLAKITPGNRLNLRIPVPESTPSQHYVALLTAQLASDQHEKGTKGIHFYTITIDEQEVEVAIEADSQEVANKIVCARCYNIIKKEAIRNTKI